MTATEIDDPQADAAFDTALRFLEELAAVSSPSGDLAGLERAASLLAGALTARGLTAGVAWETAEDGSQQPVLHARGPAAGDSPLLLIGHIDTVLPAAPPRREDGRLFATGAIDMKGGLATLVGALDLVAARGGSAPADLHLVVVPDEEVGGPHSHAAVRTWGAGARAFWVLEPGEATPEGAETLVIGRRGMTQWRLQARGRSAHSGLNFWQGRSALAAAARWVAEGARLSRPGGGPTVSAARFVAGEAGFVDGLAEAHALLGSERQINVVPDRAVVEGEIRFLRPREGEEVVARLAALAGEIAAESGVGMDFSTGLAIPPLDPRGPQRTWAERAVELAARRGWRLQLDEERGGISFPNFLPDPGRLPVLDGLGPAGGGMHTREEFVDLASLRRRIVLLADLLEADAAQA